jgi:hypothetical protein
MRGIIRVGDATSHGGKVISGSAVSEVIGRQVLFKKPAPFTIASENFPAFLRFSETFPAPAPPTPAGLFASQASNHGTKENTTARAMRYSFKPSVRALSPFQPVTPVA